MDNCHPALWEPLRPQLPPHKLDEYLRALSRRYHFVSLSEAVEMLDGRKPIQPYSIVLTFDDGYRNNFTHALPILRRYSAPATFFVATDFAGSPRPFWFDRLDYALQQVPVHGREVRVGSLAMRLDASSRNALCESYKRLRRTAKRLQMSDYEFLDEMDRVAVQLEAESGHSLAQVQQDDDWSAIATWDVIREAVGEDVTIGSHTADHIRLGHVSEGVARDQLIRSKQDIEENTHEPCWCVCYPNGSYAEAPLRLARECAYACGLTTEEGLNSVGDDIMRLKRLNLPIDVTSSELLTAVSGLSKCVSQVKRKMKELLAIVGRAPGRQDLCMSGSLTREPEPFLPSVLAE